MLHSAIPATLLALVVPAVGTAVRDRTELAQLSIHERIIIRVPRMSTTPPRGAAPVVSPIRWKEKRGPKCLAAANFAGAAVSAPDTVDLMMGGGQWMRAKLNGGCRPLDYYAGFYVKPGPDGMVCAERDAIRTRSGAMCPIDSFKKLRARH